MNNTQTEERSLNLQPEKLLAFVGELIGASVGREDDDHPLPPGPWDPVIRAAWERSYALLSDRAPWAIVGPQPDPWRTSSRWKVFLASILASHPEIYDAIGGGHNPGAEVALNPQPLPPRAALMVSIARIVTERAELLQEIAGAMASQGERQGIIIVGGYVNRFCDDVCGNGFRVVWPFPGPRPHWFDPEIHGIDLVIMATQFEQGAKEAFSPELRRTLTGASARLLEAGLAMMR